MKLIINADDAGIDVSRNHGIFDTMDHGLVTSCSAIVEQGGWKDLLLRVKGRKDIGIGFHFNLTAGKPLAKKLKTLVDSHGHFFNKFELFEKAMARMLDQKEIQRELKAQLKAFQVLGHSPSHYDSHNHVHLLPGVREAFFDVVPIGSWVRLPSEKKDPCFPPSNEDPKSIWGNPDHLVAVLNYFSVIARRQWQKKFRYVDDFTGSKITPAPNLEKFKKAMKSLKGEVVELMCHPGSEPDELAVNFSKLKERQVERDVLMSDELKDFLEKGRIELVSFQDLNP